MYRPKNNRVLAVVVTYQPDDLLERNLESLREQVDLLLVVDNGSANAGEISAVAARLGCRFIGNLANVGIAAAFNQGIELADREKFAWVAIYDQDSLVPPGAIEELLRLHATHPLKESIGVIATTHQDRGTGLDYRLPGNILEELPDWRRVRVTISSGSLIPTKVFNSIGQFDTSLFIDSVDYDFCMRCRKHGLVIIESRRSVLEHRLGNATVKSLLGKRFVITNHSPMRRYYMTRNQLEVCLRNVRVDLLWAVYGLYVLATSSFFTLIYETDRIAKGRAMLRGVVDFALRRFGRRH